jgi:hypothetical protein
VTSELWGMLQEEAAGYTVGTEEKYFSQQRQHYGRNSNHRHPNI